MEDQPQIDNKKTTSPIQAYTTLIKDTITILAGIAAIGYAAGFMIVNTSLMLWGITDVTVVKVRYISVGFLFIVHSVLVLGMASLGMLNFVRETQKNIPTNSTEQNLASANAGASDAPTNSAHSRWRKAIRPFSLILVLFGATALLSLALAYLTSTNVLGDGTAQSFWGLSNNKKWWFWFIASFVSGFLWPIVMRGISNRKWLYGVPHVSWAIGVTILMFLFAVKSYATSVYPKSAPSVGGGDYFLVKLIPAEDKAKIVAQLMSTAADVNPKWAWLLDQTDKAYFVLAFPGDYDENTSPFEFSEDRCRAVEIEKSLIQGILHYNSNVDHRKEWDSTK